MSIVDDRHGAPVDPERLLAPYRGNGGWDELLAADGRVRPHWAYLAAAIDELGRAELERRRASVARHLRNDGVTYQVYGRGDGRSAAWSLDPIPLLVASDDWSTLEEGIVERAEVLNLVLADLYGPRHLIKRGVLPPEVVYGHRGYLLPCVGIDAPGGQPLFTYAADVARGPDGALQVIGDFAEAPSGFGYADENRTVISRVFPTLYRDTGVHRLAPFFRALRAGLGAAAPRGVSDPRIVLLTPGTFNETYFEHAHLASTLGYPLVEGSDLCVRDGRVWLRSLGGLEPVHVILRRVDGWFCDPLELRPDSHLGVPGLLEACRRGNVSVVNPLGASVLENPGLAAFLDAAATHLIGRPLRLASTPTWWCGDATSRAHVLANLGSLVIKPISRQPGRTAIFGADLTAAQLDHLRRRIEAEPHLFVGQELAATATVPTLGASGLEARHALLRAFAVAREGSYAVMPGALTRVAPTPDGLLVSNQAGALAKDTWVLASEPEQHAGFWLRQGPGIEAVDPAGTMPSRAAENLFWLGRYAERAEATARLLRAALDRRNDFQVAADATSDPVGMVNPDGLACLHALLMATTDLTATWPGFRGDGADERLATPEPELLSLAGDATRAGSLAHALAALTAAANAVRDQLSGDTWLVLSSLGRELDPLDPRAVPPLDLHMTVQATLAGVLRGLLALAGLAAENMVRDPGWAFLDVGRRIERALLLVRLLRSTVTTERGTATDSLLYESVLIATESIITYRRRYRSQAQLETLLDLLLLDEHNPRSLVFGVQRLTEEVAALPRPAQARLADEERTVLELATTVRLADTEALAAEGALDDWLAQVEVQLRTLADQVELAHFLHVPPAHLLVPAAPEAGGDGLGELR